MTVWISDSENSRFFRPRYVSTQLFNLTHTLVLFQIIIITMFTIVSRLICFFSYQIWSVDEDECAENTHNCDSNSYCKNAPGSFHCHCKHGFSRDKSSSCSGRNIMLLCNQRHLIFFRYTPAVFFFISMMHHFG